jgi:hypothetical protein
MPPAASPSLPGHRAVLASPLGLPDARGPDASAGIVCVGCPLLGALASLVAGQPVLD